VLQNCKNTINLSICTVFRNLKLGQADGKYCTFNTTSLLQSLEDRTDLAQALYAYALLMGYAFTFCSLGTELSQQVRDKCPPPYANYIINL